MLVANAVRVRDTPDEAEALLLVEALRRCFDQQSAAALPPACVAMLAAVPQGAVLPEAASCS
eukprot:NODE_5950_length_542_cov_107.924025.p5 GENE.NODE_5950_length_542_cov_107.924025~~NODE_5950_length_542_cov_107.924025.p5  ORF type:complete len:62 (+),score=11.12 NODE_5950_length_542_cov_107.924025:280-465(+)